MRVTEMLQQSPMNERATKAVHPIRNVRVHGRRTSVRLEPEFWEGLNELLERENVTLDDFCNHVEARKGDASFSSTMRSQILGYFRRR
ncbi:MAG: aryl-sulfate sulfotransferase [Rhodospirillaceae bacterium]|nr:MAG: aryl-sulfate sulfotransferase [Rhodospirillaceae bacterium]